VLAVAVPVATMWTAPDAPRGMDLPAVRDVPDVAAWAASLDTAARKELNGRTLTQLLLGERVRVVEADGGWVRAIALDQASSADPCGYPGWVRRAHLAGPAPPVACTAVVVAASTTCDVDDGESVELSFGTRLGLEAGAGRAEVLLPGGRRGKVRMDDVRLTSVPATVPEASDLLAAAERFLGLRYLWGGTSAWGLDCSGLVHLVFRRYGIALPRDAFDQAAAVQPVPVDEVQPGDLYFFARPNARVYHVGFVSRVVGADGVRWMLHAPEGGELVEDAPLAPHRIDTLVSAGRVCTPRAGRLRPSGGS
jgi:hypothetical protein